MWSWETACSLDWLNSSLARTDRERDRHSRIPHQSYPWKKSRFHPGRVLRRRPGSGEAPFCGLANLWTAFQTSSTNHSPMGIFSRIRRREKKEKIPAHTNSCSRLLKLPAEAVWYHKYRKNAHLKLIFLPISREAVIPLLSTTVFQYWPRLVLEPAQGLSPRGLGCLIRRYRKGCLEKVDLFRSSSKTPPIRNRTKPNLTQHTLGPLDETDPDTDLEDSVRVPQWKAPASVKRRLQVAGRGAPCLVIDFQRFLVPEEARFRMGCSASGKSFGRGPCPKWPAGREHRPTIPPVGKREELRTRTACQSGQREETGGQRGIRRVYFRSD